MYLDPILISVSGPNPHEYGDKPWMDIGAARRPAEGVGGDAEDRNKVSTMIPTTLERKGDQQVELPA